ALVAGVPTVRALRRAWEHGDWDSTATLVFGVGILASLPTLLSNLVFGTANAVDPFGNAVVGLSGWAYRVDQIATGALVIGGLVFFWAGWRRGRSPVNGGALIAI